MAGWAGVTRETTEELGCTVEVGRQVAATTPAYDFGVVTLTTFFCKLVAGTPVPSEHTAIAWLSPDELGSLDWAAADVPSVRVVEKELGP